MKTPYARPPPPVHARGMEAKIENGRHPELDKFYRDIRTVVEDGEHLLKVGVESVRHQAIAAGEKTDRLLRERPYESMALVFGVGVVAGLLLSSLLTGED